MSFGVRFGFEPVVKLSYIYSYCFECAVVILRRLIEGAEQLEALCRELVPGI